LALLLGVNMKEAEAFSPTHITGFFQIFDQETDLLHAGSRGTGISLTHGVKTHVKIKEASKNSLQIKINGSTSASAEVSEYTVKKFLSHFERAKNFEIIVEHHVEAPIGVGFGTSGAAALSLALALNKAFDSGMSKIEAAQLAHIVEVECKTGLGTVIAEAFGGIEIRVKPGAPGIGKIIHVPTSKDYMVACLTFEPLSTKKCLTDQKTRKRINELGGQFTDKLIEEPNVTNFLNFSRQFAEHLELITEKIRGVLDVTDSANFVCSMPMFGEAVFTILEPESLDKLLKIFLRFGPRKKIIVSKIDHEGARLLE